MTVRPMVLPTHPGEIFVDGRWSSAAGGRLELIDPATEEVVGEALDTAPGGVARAVVAARRSFDEGVWRRRPIAERIEILQRVLAALVERADEMVDIQTTEMGAPITVSRAMNASCSILFRAYVDGARAVAYEYLRRDAAGQSLIRREPVGVVAAITPWNGPLATVLNKAIPSLLTGCSVVLKPAPETPVDAGIVAELCSEAGVPDGVFNVVTGGRATGQALVAHPDVDKVTFTGSTAAGREVGEICGRNLKRVSLELGGKSAGIVLDDADLTAAAPQVVAGNFFNSGQACIAITRVLVPAGRHDEIVDALRAEAAGWILGDPRDEETQLGPLVSRRQRDRVERYLAAGRDQGARAVLGGGRPAGLDRGWYIEPTILVDVRNDMTVAREEIFGPVMSVIRYDTEEEAIAIANDSDYGLHGAVFTTDTDRGLEVAGRIRSGSVNVNGSGLTPATPYGGVKGSGLGREHGREGVEDFLELHSFVVPTELFELLEADGVPVS